MTWVPPKYLPPIVWKQILIRLDFELIWKRNRIETHLYTLFSRVGIAEAYRDDAVGLFIVENDIRDVAQLGAFVANILLDI